MWFNCATLQRCISTALTARRETSGWKWPLFMVGYQFESAKLMAGISYRLR